MLASYLESIKYVGHLWPVAFARIFLGYQYISLVIGRIQQGYLEYPHISESLRLSESSSPGFYFELFKTMIQSQWLPMTYILIILEIFVGVSYLLGFGVRLAGLVGVALSLHLYAFFELPSSPGQLYLLLIHLMFVLLGAGRCLGLDFYFFKSRRGLLW